MLEQEDKGVLSETNEDEFNFGKRKAQDNNKNSMPNSKRPKIDDSKPNRLPTAEELVRMHETTALYHSSAFREQMEKLLKNITIIEKAKIHLILWLKTFTKFLAKIPVTSEKIDLSDWSSHAGSGVALPLLHLPCTAGSFQFMPPSSVSFTGSFTTDTATTQNRVVDLLLEVPQSCLDEHDHRNGRWLLKRAHYLAYVAQALRKCGAIEGAPKWGRHMGEPLRPVLLVYPNLPGSAGKWRIQILPVPAPGVFKPHAFAPHKPNVKHKGASSCQYLNFLCGVDTAMSANCELLRTALDDAPGLKQGLQLAKVWLGQRQLYKGRGAVSGHLLSMLMLHLLRTRRVRYDTSAYQAFRMLLHYIDTECNWSECGVNMYESALKGVKDAPTNKYANTLLSTARFHELYPVVFVDPSGYCNLAAPLFPHIVKQLKQEASRCLKLLNVENRESFDLLFIQRANFNISSDQSIVIHVSDASLQGLYSSRRASSRTLLLNQLHPAVFSEQQEEEDEDSPVGEVYPLVTEVYEVLQRGLGDRVSLLTVEVVAPQDWEVDEPARPLSKDITFGLKINQVSAWALITKDDGSIGSSSDFRQFWGGKSELRRFQDGTACEAVVWVDDGEGQGDARRVPGKIAKLLCHWHFQIPENDVFHVGPVMESTLRLPSTHPDSKAYSTGEEACITAVNAYDALCRLLRSLQVKLPVTSIATSSPLLAHAQVFPRPDVDPTLTPEEQALKACAVVDPVEVLVFLERSGKWPTTLRAVESIRRLMHLEMYWQLRKQRVPVLYSDTHFVAVVRGYAFGVRVVYQGEMLMLRQRGVRERHEAGEEVGDVSEVDTPLSLQLQIKTTITPRIVSALAGLRRLHPSYSGAVRLCRRWLSGNMVEPHFPPLVIQLLVAHLYVNPGHLQVPGTPHVAFIRFLTLLSTTDWRFKPFFVDITGDFHPEDLEEIRSLFNNSRDSLPILFLATPYDIRGGHAKISEEGGINNMEASSRNFRYRLVSHWSSVAPTVEVLGLLCSLADRDLVAYTVGMRSPGFSPHTLFQPVTSMYDMIIHLDHHHISKIEHNVHYASLNIKPVHSTGSTKLKKSKKRQQQHSTPLLYMHPMRLMQHLEQTTLGQNAVLFYDSLGGDKIGACVWPGALDVRENVKVPISFGFQLLSTKKPISVQLDLPAIAEHTEMMYKPLVKNVTLRGSTSNK